MMENLVWKAYYHSMSGHEIRPFNIFEHGRFREEVRKLLLKCTEKEAFAEELYVEARKAVNLFLKYAELFF